VIGAFRRSGRIATVALRLLYLIFQQGDAVMYAQREGTQVVVG